MSAVQRLYLAHAVLVASAIAGTSALMLAAYRLMPRFGIVAAIVVGAVMVWWMRAILSRRRVALWIEERVPSLRYALASLTEAPDTPFRPHLEARVRETRFAKPLGVAVLRLAVVPVLILAGVHFVVAPLLAAHAPGISNALGGAGPEAPGAARARDLRIRVAVTPPEYAGQRSRTLDNPVSVAALVGSDIRVTGAFTTRTTMPAEPTVLRLGNGGLARMIALEPQPDSTPRVVLEYPARDTVLRTPAGGLRLSAQLRDDIGLATGWFEIIVSSGTGELFEFRTATLGRAALGSTRQGAISAALPLDSLKLQPGDVVHIRAVARDNNPRGEPGTSETRALRVPRPSEDDSLAIDAMPPPEVNRSEVSQRMLIIVTERLVARIPRISKETLGSESANIARDQARLRKRVGEIIFMRLTGEEHADEDAAAAMDDTLSPGEALLKAASEATNLTEEHAHEDSPLLGVNRNLLEAFNAMWDAERRLGITEPRQALPFMRAALDAIQRARAAERLYLRGRAPKVVLDVAKLRLTGKTEGIDPGTRSPRASALRELQARRARLDAAIDMLASSPAAAMDSLMLVRIDALGESPALAAALGSAIEDLRSGRDATSQLITAYRAIAGEPVAVPYGRWSGGGGGGSR